MRMHHQTFSKKGKEVFSSFVFNLILFLRVWNMLLWEMLQHKPRSSFSNGLNIALLCGGSFIWSRNNEERFFLSQLTIIEAIINDFRICFRRENGLSGQWFFPVSMSFLKTYPRESEVMTVLIFHTMYIAHTGNNSN